MEATWTVLSRHPIDTVVWRHLRTCDVLALLCVNKSIRESTRRAFDSAFQPKTTIYDIEYDGEPKKPETIVHIGVSVMIHGRGDQCVVRATIVTDDSTPRTFLCKWRASATPRYGKLLITSVRRLLDSYCFKHIYFSFTSPVGAHHSIVAQQMNLIERDFNAKCSLTARLFAEQLDCVERVGHKLIKYRGMAKERRRIADLLKGPTERFGRQRVTCAICDTILFKPAYVNFAFRYWSTALSVRIAQANDYLHRSAIVCARCGGPLHL